MNKSKNGGANRGIDDRAIHFFDIISPKTLIVNIIWCVVISGALFGLVMWLSDEYPELSRIFAVTTILTVVGIFALIIVLKIVKQMKFMIEEDSEIITNVLGGTMISCNDEMFTVKKCTPEFLTLLGYKPGEIKEKYQREFYKLLVGDESREAFRQQKRELQSNGHAQARYKLLKGDGTEIWVSSRSYLTQSGSDEERSVYTVLFDISEEMNLQQQYRLAEVRNKIVFENINSGIFEWDLMNGTIEISDQLVRRYFSDSDGVIDVSVIKHLVTQDDYQKLLDKVEELRDGKSAKVKVTMGLLQSDGKYSHADVNLIAIPDNNNVVVRAVGMVLDVEERHKRELHLRRKADRDSLTGIYNKGATRKLIENTIEVREDQEHVMVLCDVDNFKTVNDTFGHGEGDNAIKMIANFLSEIFGADNVVGRIGGDEFMVFIRSIDGDYDKVKSTLSRLKDEHPVLVVGDKKHDLTMSVGAALYPGDAKDYESLYKAADVALYKAKEAGKNRFELYSK